MANSTLEKAKLYVEELKSLGGKYAKEANKLMGSLSDKAKGLFNDLKNWFSKISGIFGKYFVNWM